MPGEEDRAGQVAISRKALSKKEIKTIRQRKPCSQLARRQGSINQ
jgi:hypothetical protein